MRAKRIAVVGTACVACGNCVKYCKPSAIAVHNGLRAVVDEHRCVGCGRCAEACPAGIISCENRKEVPA